ncbi:hypothetical protein [Streptomyces sp. NPDC005303]|uniref:hypothetical protein n=1 Tax=Streptomyces sp. NPDC005303 TaxID=3155713 RepID=UPI0033B6C0FD
MIAMGTFTAAPAGAPPSEPKEQVGTCTTHGQTLIVRVLYNRKEQDDRTRIKEVDFWLRNTPGSNSQVSFWVGNRHGNLVKWPSSWGKWLSPPTISGAEGSNKPYIVPIEEIFEASEYAKTPMVHFIGALAGSSKCSGSIRAY